MLSGIRASLAVPLLDLQQKLYLQQQQIGCEGSGFHLARPWMLKETVTKKKVLAKHSAKKETRKFQASHCDWTCHLATCKDRRLEAILRYEPTNFPQFVGD